MARFLRGSEPAGINGQMAEAMMLTLAGDEAQAVERLNDIGTNNVAALPMVRALQARNTGDYLSLIHILGEFSFGSVRLQSTDGCRRMQRLVLGDRRDGCKITRMGGVHA